MAFAAPDSQGSVYNLPLGARGIWLGPEDWIFPNGTWTLTRGAAGEYYQLKTAGAATTNPAINLSRAIRRVKNSSVNAPLGAEVQEGGILTEFDLYYSIATAGLTSLTPSLYETQYLNNTAPNTVSPGGTLTAAYLVGSSLTKNAASPALPVATQTQPYVVRVVLTTPYLIGVNFTNVSDYL